MMSQSTDVSFKTAPWTAAAPYDAAQDRTREKRLPETQLGYENNSKQRSRGASSGF
jgi:hypothetical protein